MNWEDWIKTQGERLTIRNYEDMTLSHASFDAGYKLAIEKAAYKEADAAEKKKLRSLFLDFDKIFPVTERVKTIVDAIRELGGDNFLVGNLANLNSDDENLRAFIQLRIICTALNDGWVAKPEDNGGYYPGFMFYTDAEVKEMGDEVSDDLYVFPPKFDTKFFAVDCTFIASLISENCLLLKTPELAKYCGTQFIDIWMNYLLPVKKDNY